MVDPEARKAAFAWFDEADRLWRQLADAETDEEFRRIAKECGEATMTGLRILERARKVSDLPGDGTVGLA
jgi:hypothetical protein